MVMCEITLLFRKRLITRFMYVTEIFKCRKKNNLARKVLENANEVHGVGLNTREETILSIYCNTVKFENHSTVRILHRLIPRIFFDRKI
jgi:hypothetical protein